MTYSVNIPSSGEMFARYPNGYNWETNGDGPWLLANPDLYDKVCIDGFRTGGGNYTIDTLYAMARTVTGLDTLRSLVRLVGGLLDLGKDVTLYMGGIHEDTNELQWLGLARRGRMEQRLWRGIGTTNVGLNLFDVFRGDPCFSMCIDGAGTSRLMVATACFLLGVGGHRVKVEGRAGLADLLANFGSLTTADAASRAGEWFNQWPLGHDIIISNEDETVNTAANVRKWLAQGRTLYISKSYLDGSMPMPEGLAQGAQP